MDRLFEREIIAFQLITPLHIGGYPQKYTPFDYITYQENLYIIDENKLSAWLKEKNLISKYVSEVNSLGHQFNLFKFLSENLRSLSQDFLDQISRYQIRVVTDEKFSEFHTFIRDGRNVPYIPGSSIKGLIRSAVLYKILKTLKEKDSQRFQGEIISKIKNKKNFKGREPFKWLINKWLQDFQIDGKEKSSYSDWLRLIRVRDAYPVFHVATRLYEVIIFSHNGKKWQEKEKLFVECLPGSSIYQFEILIDKSLLRYFKVPKHLNLVKKAYPKTIEDIFKAIYDFSQDLLKEERKDSYLQTIYQTIPSEAFCLGWGGGLLHKTIFLLLPEETRKFIRNNLKHKRGEAIAPKSRRILREKQKLLPLGWAKLVHDGEEVFKTANCKLIIKLHKNKFKLIKKI